MKIEDISNIWILDRVAKIKAVLTEDSDYYLAYSGGSDSELVSFLIDLALPDNQIRRVYWNTFAEHEITRNYVKNKAKNDHRFEIYNTPIPNFKEVGYPFKSKDFSESLDDLRRHNGEFVTLKSKRLIDTEHYTGKYTCPKILEYLLKSQPFPISRKCCYISKKQPGDNFAKASKLKVITGISRSEKGARTKALCITKDGNFNPLALSTSEQIEEMKEWAISHGMPINPLYLPPYNFKRTGCVGCPYNTNIQQDLEAMYKYSPVDFKKAMYFFGTVYDEYARIGYRIKPDLFWYMMRKSAK